jgi:hypothetical protein
MGLALVNGHLYYRKSIRRGGKVTSEYRGSGDLAVFVAILDEEHWEEVRARREAKRRSENELAVARQARREARQALGNRLSSIDRTMASYHRRIGKTVEAILTALGYHRHARGQWRRRRAPMSNPLATVSVAELVKLAREGDRVALGELSYKADRWLYEKVEALDGDLAGTVVEPMLIANLGPGYYGNREGVAARLAILRRELAPPGSSIAEELMAERAALCWLHVQLVEMDRADLLQQPEADYRKITMIDQCLTRAQARFSQALTALAKIRRLNLPIVINQVNVGAQVNGVQIAGE